jgi:DNA (cytosine-5)-methyltransferase 1
VCSGIEAATVAWEPLGWEPVAFSEIEPFPSAVLNYQYPDVHNLGDFTQIEGKDLPHPDLLVGGTPCQDFSHAGLRAGLSGQRGQLTIEFLGLASRLMPEWIVWENVPGVLSVDRGRAFGTFLGALGELGYGFAYRVLDAQYFGIPQRRKRVFVVANLRDWRRAASVLFEPESLSGDIKTGRKKREITSAFTANSLGGVGVDDNTAQASHIIAPPLTVKGANGPVQNQDAVMVAFTCKDYGADVGETSPTLRALNNVTAHPNGGGQVAVATKTLVRRLTPRECERLQGFPDDWTAVPYRNRLVAADTPRYRAIGNSMAVPVMAWIGNRIDTLERSLR